MAWRLVLVLFLSTAINTGIAAAQANDEPFCALAPIEMLAALDGNWSLTQNAGVAVGAGMAMPLPAHPPQNFTIEFDETTSIANLSGGSPRQNLAMVPTSPVEVGELIWFMTEAEAEGLLEIGGGCDYFGLPVMLGFTTYALTQPDAGPGEYVLGVMIGGGTATLCLSRSDVEGVLEEGVVQADDLTGVVLAEADDRENPAWLVCDANVPPPRPGTMVMSLALKFQSPSFATGMLHFEGKQSGHSFFAKAPVTMSR